MTFPLRRRAATFGCPVDADCEIVGPMTGQFPTRYERPSKGSATLHWGPDRPAGLLVPVLASS